MRVRSTRNQVHRRVVNDFWKNETIVTWNKTFKRSKKSLIRRATRKLAIEPNNVLVQALEKVVRPPNSVSLCHFKFLFNYLAQVKPPFSKRQKPEIYVCFLNFATSENSSPNISASWGGMLLYPKFSKGYL